MINQVRKFCNNEKRQITVVNFYTCIFELLAGFCSLEEEMRSINDRLTAMEARTMDSGVANNEYANIPSDSNLDVLAANTERLLALDNSQVQRLPITFVL